MVEGRKVKWGFDHAKGLIRWFHGNHDPPTADAWDNGPTRCNNQRARWGNISSWYCTVGSDQTWDSLSKAWLRYAPKCRHWLETLLLAMFTWFILYETTVDLARVASPEGCLSGQQVYQPSLKTWVWKKNNPWGLSVYLRDGAREEETRPEEQEQKSIRPWRT